MSTIVIVILSVLAAIIFYLVFAYNRLVSFKNLTQEGWSGIDIQLKQRANLIPNLIEAVKGYMAHEKELLEKVTELRTQALTSTNIPERAANENMLTQALRQVFAVSENYPDLKASQNFHQLQDSLVAIENQIQLARRYYNGAARDLNIAIQSFPSNLIAKQFHFLPVAYFEIEDPKEREVPNVKFT
jgi:LemA protein